MPRVVCLDTGPLGLVTQRRGVPEADACRRWVTDLTHAGVSILVPEVADYELRRELVRAGKRAGLARLDAFNTAREGRYLPITTTAMRLAAELWAQVRNAGLPTADAHALDVDVILAAQALSAGIPATDLLVASVNVRHIARFVASDVWSRITP
jgi:predicted nucleic acid-binding protein